MQIPEKGTVPFFYFQYYVFPFLNGKGIGLPHYLPQGGPTGWLVKENHPHCVPVFSFTKPCAKRQSKGQGPIKSGKHIPMGLFIH